MSRDPRLFMDDILLACTRIQTLRDKLDREALEEDWVAHDAILRNLEIIGEAVKHLPDPLKQKRPEIPWRSIVGLRNILTHAYFCLETDIIWDIVTHQIDPLHEAVTMLLSEN